MESPTANNNNNNLSHQMTMMSHTDDQTLAQPPPPPSTNEVGNNTNNNNNNINDNNNSNHTNNNDPNGPQCFTNSCYVASEPAASQPPPTNAAVVVQPQSGLVMAASQIASLNLNAIDLENGNSVQMTAKERELVQEILVRERRIRELEEALRSRNEEVAELRSHLDKFQSVFPFNNQRGTPVKGIPKFSGIVLPSEVGVQEVGVGVPSEEGASSQQESAVVVNSGLVINNNNSAAAGGSAIGGSGGSVTPPPIVVMQHRQRAQGISAEPQSSRSMYELLNVTFPKFDKEER